ncbi:MAG: permease [Ignavibacteria bacterium CG2_30_36_16]|nr:NCS2 family permease [Ignavibacteria bacterium]OIP63677.1 MAG: permease [Ignavibacteria bacterium CG2_30_36_16]PJB00936.1 MAG: permease [Ignavibacteria bacterium CG_4_9_14_3_um_filter_36_18]
MEKYFKFELFGTNFKTEVIAGITTFLATMYIIIVNPAVLADAGMSFSGVLTATVLVCAFSSIMMGIYANNPIVLAPGMGINAFFTYSVVLEMGVKWEVALGAVFWSGVFFLLLSVFNARKLIVDAIPKQIRYAIAAGLGLFITFLGFVKSKFIIANPATYLGIGELDVMTVTFLIGLMITAILVVKKIKGALILGVTATTLLAIPIGRIYGDASAINSGVSTLVTWKGLISMPDFSVFLKLDLIESLKLSLVPVIFAMLFTDMFDSISTFIGVAEAADLVDENGEPRNIKQSLIVDSFATLTAGLFGSSAGTSYIESATGVEEGGRTGLTAIVAGLLFLPFMFLSPILSMIPAIATAPALILVGVFMMKPVLKINWDKYDDAIPALFGMILIPLTSSITQGIIWSFITWTIIKIAIGKHEDVNWMLIVIDVLAVVALVL